MFRDFIHLFLPDCCLTCQATLVRGERLICTSCFYALPQTIDHDDPNNAVAQKLLGRLPIEHAMALYKFRKEGKIQQLIHHLKYKNKPAVGVALGRRYGMLLQEERGLANSFDLIVPVPLHSSRLRQRGYNQSDFFAQGLSETLHVPWSNQYLHRGKSTITQTKKGRVGRFRNIEGSFYVAAENRKEVQGKHLLLVDDIITTGATLVACGTTLLAAGATKISVATIATAD